MVIPTLRRIVGPAIARARLGWEFRFLLPISGTPIGSGIPIPFLIPEILVGFFLEFCCWKIDKLEFRFQNLEFRKKKCRNLVHLILYQKNGCRHTYIYSKRLPPYLHLLNAGCRHTYIYSMPVATIPTSTQNGCRYTYIYSTPVPPYLYLLNAGCRHTYIYSKKKAGMFSDSWNLRRIEAGEDSEPAGTCSVLAGAHFTIRKIKFWWKFRRSKGPESE